MKCKYWDCGFCYAPVDVETNATQGGCFEPEYCLCRKSQMTNQQPLDIIEIGGVKYQRIEEPKPQTLLEYFNSFGIVGAEGICNIFAKWLPDELEYEEDEMGYNQGWNDCLQYLKENLK
jgi:hypothetical protein